MSSHSSESVGSDWCRQKGIQFSSLDRKCAHCTVQTQKCPTYTRGKLSWEHIVISSTVALWPQRCRTANFTDGKLLHLRKRSNTERDKDKKPLKTLRYRLKSDMAVLVAGLLICLMAVQTIQHDGKFSKIL